MSTVKDIDYNKRAKINTVIIMVFLALGYFASQVPEKPKPQDPFYTVATEYTESFGNLLINVKKPITNEECATYIIKSLKPNSDIETIFVFDPSGQVCFSNLKRDSGIVYTKELFKQ